MSLTVENASGCGWCYNCGEYTYMGHQCGAHSCPGALFQSGAKSSEEKPRYDLIPAIALEREANRMAEGAKAHGENNYRHGKSDPAFVRDRINHMIEHALKYAAGDRTTDHLAGVRCNAAILMWLEQ